MDVHLYLLYLTHEFYHLHYTCKIRKGFLTNLSNIINYTLLRGLQGASQVVLMENNPPANAGDVGDGGSIPGSGRPPGGGHGNSFQCSCLENPMDRGSWQATVHGIPKSQTKLK